MECLITAFVAAGTFFFTISAAKKILYKIKTDNAAQQTFSTETSCTLGDPIYKWIIQWALTDAVWYKYRNTMFSVNHTSSHNVRWCPGLMAKMRKWHFTHFDHCWTLFENWYGRTLKSYSLPSVGQKWQKSTIYKQAYIKLNGTIHLHYSGSLSEWGHGGSL